MTNYDLGVPTTSHARYPLDSRFNSEHSKGNVARKPLVTYNHNQPNIDKSLHNACSKRSISTPLSTLLVLH